MMDSSKMIPCVLLPGSALRRIRVTCRCQRSWIEEFPAELAHCTDIAPFFECTSCHTCYALISNVLTRVEDGLLTKSIEASPLASSSDDRSKISDKSFVHDKGGNA